MTKPPIDVEAIVADILSHGAQIAALTLAPCPFCGSSDVTLIRTLELWYALCAPECSAAGPPAATFEEAARLWNTRAESPELTELRDHLAERREMRDRTEE